MVEITRPGRAQLRAQPAGGAAALGAPDGVAAASRCPRCALPVGPDFQFCAQCGQRLSDQPADFALRDPLIGALIADRYRLVAKLGQGGMGTVYKVEHVRMGKPLALKLLHGELARDQAMIHRFSREARAISRLTSRNAVQCFDFGHDNGLFFIVMELLTGRDLGDLLSELTALSPRRTAMILQQAASALGEAHRKGIVHRDLKPENLFVCAAPEGEDEVVKVLDFGLAKLRERSQIDTQQGALMGTPHFMAPEQIQGLEVDHRADVYALAAVAFKLLTGQPPYPSHNPLIALYRHLHDPIPSVGEVRPHLAPLQPFFDAALAKDPDRRFQSVDALAVAFAHALRDLAPQVTTARRAALSADDLTAPTVGDATPLREAGAADDAEVAAAAEALHAVAPEDAAEDAPASAGAASSLERAPEGRRLLPTLRRSQHIDLLTRQEFERFERSLRLRQVVRASTAVALIVFVGGLLYWGLALDGFFNFDREQEPNDTLKTANRLRTGHAISGSLGEPSTVSAQQDQDVFRVEGVAPGKMLTVSVTGIEGVNALLEVVNMRGERLHQQDVAGEGGGEVIPNMPMTKDPLFVAVREQVAAGKRPKFRPDLHYSLRVDVRDPLPGEEQEPNNGLSTASPLDAMQSAAGVLGGEQDLDHFLLPKVPPDATGVILRLSSVPRLDVVIALLDANGDLIEEVDRGALSEGEVLRAGFEGKHVIEPLYARVRALRGTFHPKLHYQLNFEASFEAPTPPPASPPAALTPAPAPQPEPPPPPQPPPAKRRRPKDAPKPR